MIGLDHYKDKNDKFFKKTKRRRATHYGFYYVRLSRLIEDLLHFKIICMCSFLPTRIAVCMWKLTACMCSCLPVKFAASRCGGLQARCSRGLPGVVHAGVVISVFTHSLIKIKSYALMRVFKKLIMWPFKMLTYESV